MQAGVNPLNPEVFFKKLRKPLDDRFLLFRAIAAAEAGDRREDLVDIRSGRFERTVAERVGDEALRFCGLQLSFCIVNVDLHLPDEFNFKHNIIADILFVSIRFRAVRLIKVEIHSLAILKISLREKYMPGNLVKCA